MSDSCLFCGKAAGETDRYEVKMHGEHQTKAVGLKRAHSWENVTVGAPVSRACARSAPSAKSARRAAARWRSPRPAPSPKPRSASGNWNKKRS